MKETTNNKKIRVFLLPAILISLLTALDQFTKYIVLSSFQLYESKPVIKGVFSFTYIQNRGMAWGMFQGKIPIFLIFTSIILLLCFRIMYNVVDIKRYRWVKYVLIFLVSGALGNLIDRVSLGYVIDFIHFELIDFPVFNVADIYVVLSMFTAIILLMFIYSNKEVDEILKLSFKTKVKEEIETFQEENTAEELDEDNID
ncbi:MAG: signal peptidase II [Lachnospiraceae bacterium]|nr:signal peptidase II [Lachnospiraceae bacterium]